MSNSMITRILCGLAAGMMACTGAEASGGEGSAAATTPAGSVEAARPPEQYVVIVDVSSSVASRRAATRTYALAVMDAVSFGDRLVVMLAPNEGVASAVPPLASEMPSLSMPGLPTFDDTLGLSDVKNSLTPRIRTMLDSPPTRKTDLVAALHEAAQRVQGAGGRTSTIVLLSDMLQCAAGVCFDGGGPIPDQRWIDQRKQEGVIPNLNRVCVMVIGADATTSRGVEVRRFWQRYFAAAGATLDDAHYVHSITAAEMSPCRRR